MNLSRRAGTSPLVSAAERICWLVELIASHDVADPDEQSVLVAANPDLGRFLEAAVAASERERDDIRAEVGAEFIREELAKRVELNRRHAR